MFFVCNLCFTIGRIYRPFNANGGGGRLNVYCHKHHHLVYDRLSDDDDLRMQPTELDILQQNCRSISFPFQCNFVHELALCIRSNRLFHMIFWTMRVAHCNAIAIFRIKHAKLHDHRAKESFATFDMNICAVINVCTLSKSQTRAPRNVCSSAEINLWWNRHFGILNLQINQRSKMYYFCANCNDAWKRKVMRQYLLLCYLEMDIHPKMVSY